MVFSASLTPDVTESLPHVLGSALESAYPADAGWDVSFGQLGFRLASSDRAPYQRGPEQVRKQQIDTSDAPGEQSLSSWWVRSQDSWDMGAGLRWFDPGTDESAAHRYGESFGIDPWTQGELSLLHAFGPASSPRSATNHVAAFEVAGVPGYVEAFGSTVQWVPSTGTVVTSPLLGDTATQPAAAGDRVWVGHRDGVSYFIPGSGTTQTLSLTGFARVWWVKARLFVAVGPTLYEVPATATGAIGTVATKTYTHPSPAWTWTDVTETAAAILASGYSSGDSAIFRMLIENDETGTPILSDPSQVTRTPNGERITCMSTYLGSSVVLGTNRGIRIGAVSDTGDVQYGPLTVETENEIADVTFRDRFAYLAVTAGLPDGSSGVVRVDLSAPVPGTGDPPRFAYAWDVPAPVADAATSVALIGDRVVLACGSRIYEQSPTALVDLGWLETGRIRFATVEPKAFRLLRCVVDTNGGRVNLTVQTPDGVSHRVVEFSDDYSTQDEVAVSTPGRPVNQYLNVRMELRPSDGNVSPVLSALSLKAQPAASRIRLYQFPLLVHDVESLRWGRTVGTKGGAYARLRELESLEESGAPVTVQDYRTGESFTGQIDAVDFTASLPPDRHEGNFEGTAVVTVRRL